MKSTFLKKALRSKKNYFLAMGLIALSLGSFGQASILFSNTSGSAWLTNTNWTGSTVPTSTDVAQMGANPTGAGGIGIDMGGSTNNGSNNQAVGAFEMTSARVTSNPVVGNSSAVSSGTLTFLGTTVNAVPNVVIRNNSPQNITFQNIQATGSQTMNLAITNTVDNKIVQDAGGKIIISCPIMGASNCPLTVQGAGNSEVDITNANNTFSGLIKLSSSETVFSADGCFGTVPGSVINNAITIDGGRMTANATYTLNANRGIKLGNTAGTSISVKTSTTILTYNGVMSDLSTGGILAKQGGNVFLVGGVNIYTGYTAINNGTIRLINGNNRLPVTTTLNLGQAGATANVGIFDLNGFNQQIAGLTSLTGTNISVAKNTVTTSTLPSTLTINGSGSYLYGVGTTSNSGVISGSVTIIKSGSSQQILGDINTYTGNTIINGGELRFSPNANETLGSSNVVLNGGMLSTTGINAAKTLSFSTLSLTDNSSITLESTNTHSLNFAGSSSNLWTAGKTLTITGWQGSYSNPAGSAGTVGRIFVGTTAADLTTAQLSQIVFFDGTQNHPAMLLATGELVPFLCSPPSLINSNNSPLCAGATLSLSAAVTGTTVLTFSWAGPNSFTSAVQNPVISSTGTAATGIYTLSVNNGCGTFTSSTIVTVNALPSVTAVTSSASVCAGQQVTLSGNGAATYTWTNIGISNGVAFTPTATAIYSVTGTGTNNCSNTTTVSVTVNVLPVISVTSATTCAGQAATLTASNANTYSWSTASGSASVIVTPTANTTYTVTGFSAQGCPASMTTQVTVNSLPVITINSATICAGASATLTANGASSYTWNTASNSSSIIISPIISTTYTASGTSTAGCVGSNTTMLTVNALPSLTVPAISICSGGSGTLSAIGASTYTWSTASNGNTISTNPASTTNYTVTGTSIAGCINSATTSIIVTSSPSITVNSVTICTGSPATLNASGVATYTWNTTANTASIVVSPTANTVYTVSGNASGCVVVATNTVSVTVNSLPPVTVNSATICSGNSATLTAGGANTYTWSTTAVSGSITPSPTTTITYTVNGTSLLGCVNSNTAQVTVTPLPNITVNSATICAGNTATISANGAASYTWNTSATTSSITVSPSTTLTYTVSSTNLGCVASKIATVTVNALPTITVSSSATVCAGGTSSLMAGGAATYTWNTSSNSTTITVNPTSNTSYTVTGTSIAGCVNSATTSITTTVIPAITATSATVCAGSTATLSASGVSTYSWSNGSVTSSITVTPVITQVFTVTGFASGCSVMASATLAVNVNSLPIVSINSASICLGSAATLTASGANTYTWSNAVLTATAAVMPASNTAYTVIATNANGCVGSNTTMVTVNPLPTVTVNSATICQGTSATLSASGANTYSWTGGTTALTLVVNPSATTVYTVTGTSLLGCSKSASATVLVNTLPVVNLSLSVTSNTVCLNDPAINIVGTPAGGIYSGASGSIFTPSVEGTFTVAYSYTNTSSCSNSTAQVLHVSACTGVKENARDNAIVIFPNPVQDKLQVRNENFNVGYSVELYDVNGKLVYSAFSSQQNTEIEMNGYNKGFYILRITANNKSSFVKFIKD